MSKTYTDNGPMLNAYPDSVGGTLSDITYFLNKKEVKDVFQTFYILPSIFNTDLDRGFSVIDYELNELLASREDLETLEKLNLDLKLDFILNHSSVLSKQFQDILKNGDNSKYKDFFINWNQFWKDHGTMTEDGYIQPDQKLIKNMFFRKKGLPILMVRMPDGKNIPYWNTFYQEVRYERLDAQDLMKAMNIQYASAVELAKMIDNELAEGKTPVEIQYGRYEKYSKRVIELLESKRKYLGQMDLNIQSPLVWDYYDDTLKTLASYGAKIVRLDAFAYAPKAPGEKNFLNNPGTWDLLKKVQNLADQYQLTLLPEIHSSYAEKTYELLAQKGYMTYDFFLPGLIIDAMERGSGETLVNWAKELQEKKIRVVNMLGCHDGIPLLDLKGLISEEQIGKLIDVVVERGGYVKNLHGQKNVYYQVNATYYSALGDDDQKMLLARAIQLFMPGKPQIWYLDLFAGKNDYEAIERAGEGGHKEINRSNLSLNQIEDKLKYDVVKKQLTMLRFRNTFAAFGFDSDLMIREQCGCIEFVWKNQGCEARLNVDLKKYEFEMTGISINNEIIFHMD
ncbi:glycosidase [Lachnotalea glycerini]|uniref:Glycosidase n=1 Tax=Lachnotalea glycerini TaxID=1763509 RepID=A0A371JK26_9FIRM|nr:glycosidase [Lachnotalea glycerini]RDY33081.1 glycosidase [Lachnotalea glycerini]